MLILQIIGGFAALLAVLLALRWFDMRCADKFGHRFLSFADLVLLTIAAIVYHVGQWWFDQARASGGDELNGLVIIALAGALCLLMLVCNFRKAGFLYGLAGSTLQAVYLTTFAVAGLVLFLAAMLLAGFVSAVSRPSHPDRVIVHRDSPW